MANQAISKTNGLVITQEGEPIKAYYHANSGGRTAYITEVWDKPQEPYLVSVEDQKYVSWAQNYRWTESWSKNDLEKRLSSYLNLKGETNLIDLKIKQNSLKGRVKSLEIITDSVTYYINKDEIRWFLRRKADNSILPSTLFELEIQRDQNQSIKKIIARGWGNGHGVGMCQKGAIGMSRKGLSFSQILATYYPGTKIEKKY